MIGTEMIEVRDFKKTFYLGLRRKAQEAVCNISFEVFPGEIFGFLGPNGAGKTTTIKALLGLIRPDAGHLRILGFEASSMAWRAQVGYMPEHPDFYEYLTGLELVVWFARLSGMGRAEAERDSKRHLERVGLGHALNRRLRGYSKGMLQRAGLAQAMVGAPKLLILDEPMTGLDPIGRRDIRELILELKAEGKTIFYSTHILPDVEMTCDRVAIIDKGVVRRTGHLTEILQETTRGVSVVISDLESELKKTVRRDFPAAKDEGGGLSIEFPAADAAQAFLGPVLSSGARLIRFEPHREDLETIFLRSLAPTPGAVSASAEEDRR